MDAGDCFFISKPGADLDRHLWIIVSDPIQDCERVLIVNMTSYDRTKDDACILQRDDHPFVKHKTCINYEDGQIVPMSQLDMFRSNGWLRLQERVGKDLLDYIRDAASRSC